MTTRTPLACSRWRSPLAKFEAVLAEPSIAACYGLLLVENGEREKALPFLEIADRPREKLFPEEAAMVAGALQRNP